MSQLTDILSESLGPALLDVMGDVITYTHGLTAVAITVVWDESPEARQGQMSAKCWGRLSDLPEGYARNDIVERGGLTYYVRNDPGDERDGAGGTFLHLRQK